MASKTSTDGTLSGVYERRIGTPSTDEEARGYWIFVLGLVFGFVGIGWLVATGFTGSVPQWPVVTVGLGLMLLIAGPIVRLPLQRWATWLVYAGVTLSLVGILWFLTAYPGWRPQASGVIGLYSLGLLVMAIGGVFVPILTDREDLEAEVSVLKTELDELRETLGNSEVNEAELAEEVATLRSTLSKTEDERDELEDDVGQLRDDVADAEADEADLAGVIRDHRTSEAQFELYEDRGGDWRWRLRHQDGDIIASSHVGYAGLHDAQQGMNAVRRDAFGASTLLVESEDALPEADSDEGFVATEAVDSQATYELYEDEAGEYRWRLRHDNGNMLAHAGQGYASRGGAEHSIAGIREYVGSAEYLQPDPTAIEVYRDEGDEWRWRLHHRNGNIIASSGEGYESRGGARRAIDRLREDIGDVDIEVYEDEAGGYRWRLAGGDDLVKADSGSYQSRDGARKAVERIRAFVPEADLIDVGQSAFEVYEDEGGEHRWRLRHRNGNVIASSGEGYGAKRGVWDGIESVKRNAPTAAVSETDS